MKKIRNIICILLAVVVLAGCSGGDTSSTKEQEKVVDTFFTHIKEGNFGKIEEITTSDYVDTYGFNEFEKQFDSMLDKEAYGATFVTEAQGFLDNLFSKMIKEYKIGKVEVKDGKTRIVVNGKMYDSKGISEINGVAVNNEIKALATRYQEEHLEELTKIYQEQGQEEMQRKIFEDLSKQIFEVFNKKVEEVEYVNFTMEFDVVKEKGTYKISSIKG